MYCVEFFSLFTAFTLAQTFLVSLMFVFGGMVCNKYSEKMLNFVRVATKQKG
jgi:hypothetical protein